MALGPANRVAVVDAQSYQVQKYLLVGQRVWHLAFSGDGKRVFRDRIDLADTGPFGERRLGHKLELTGRTWVRLEAWDIATDGAFTQPIWLSTSRQ